MGKMVYLGIMKKLVFLSNKLIEVTSNLGEHVQTYSYVSFSKKQIAMSKFSVPKERDLISNYKYLSPY
jgi:hypothetical protein